ncbi:MAG: hypothetical protein ABH878_09325 [bacterium]
MQDRLRSLKWFRTIRNITFSLSVIFLIEFMILLTNVLIWGRDLLLAALVFLIAAILSGSLSVYSHLRFRSHS